MCHLVEWDEASKASTNKMLVSIDFLTRCFVHHPTSAHMRFLLLPSRRSWIHVMSVWNKLISIMSSCPRMRKKRLRVLKGDLFALFAGRRRMVWRTKILDLLFRSEIKLRPANMLLMTLWWCALWSTPGMPLRHQFSNAHHEFPRLAGTRSVCAGSASTFLHFLSLTHSQVRKRKTFWEEKKKESPNKRRNRRLSSIFFKIFFSVAYASAFSTWMKYLPVPREKVRKRKEWQAAGKAKKHKRAYKRHVSGNISHHC